MFIYQYLVGGSFSTNDSIGEVWHGSNQPVALLRHYWAFSSSVLLDWLFLIVLLKISHRFHMGFRTGMLAGQSSTVISWSANHLEVVLALWAGAKVLLEKEISISIKLVSRCIKHLKQGSSNLILEGRCPAEFSSNLPQHTCLEVSSIPIKTLISCFRCVWLGLELNSAGTPALQDRTWWPLI